MTLLPPENSSNTPASTGRKGTTTRELRPQTESKRMAALGLPSLGQYFDLLNRPGQAEAEVRDLLNEITVGETCFFRNQPQIDALRTHVLPAVAEEKAKFGYKRLSLWSAGCSTGEEPYTLAMVLLEESLGMLRGWSVEVHATDLNERSLAHARAPASTPTTPCATFRRCSNRSTCIPWPMVFRSTTK